MHSYLTNELARSPTKATAAPTTATVRQPYILVKILTIGEQKKIIPIDKEFTNAAEKIKNVTMNLLNKVDFKTL